MLGILIVIKNIILYSFFTFSVAYLFGWRFKMEVVKDDEEGRVITRPERGDND